MGSGEESIPANKPPSQATTTTAPTQETTVPAPVPPSYNDWPPHMQAYYGAGGTPPPFFASNVASPSPYMWGNQHLIAPYGAPLPYPALYPHAGLYPHPNMHVAQDAAPTNPETEGKGPDGKDKASTKKSKGTAAVVVGKPGDRGKVTSGSGNDGASQSGESGTEGSSGSSDENTNQQESSASKKRSFNQMLADGANAQNTTTAQYNGNPPTAVPGNPAATIPGTNLNMGMDLWNASAVGSIPLRAKTNASGVSPSVVPGKMIGREGVPHEQLWVQDERELKRQKRKQSNRESARRSRLRKQAECEELQAKVETLSSENHNLHKELQRLSEECENLTTQNNSLVDELKQLFGPDAIAAINGKTADASVQPMNGEGEEMGQDTSRGNKEMTSAQMNGSFLNSNNTTNNNNNHLDPGSYRT